MTPTRRQRELERIAIHEAGHAVIGFVLGIKVQRISIEQHGSSAGYVLGRSRGHQRSAVYALAGLAAEQVLLDVPFVPQLHEHPGGDLRDTLGLLKSKCGRDIKVDDAEFAEQWSRAQVAVRAALRRIRAVARQLLDLRVIEGEDQVGRVLEGRGSVWYARTLKAIHGR